MLEIEIDGKALQVNEGCTVMEAANLAGVYIPHFCYHRKLSIAANCRMCLVQVEKAPKALPACATPVTNGMKVWTHSENAVRAQKAVMEFLLINHPLDCPICDQGGECQLQDLSVGYGCGQSRYGEEKRVVFNKDLGPLVATDMTRCINCTRCVRFMQEIAGDMELGQAYRGEHAEIMPFLGRTLDSELSGNVIDLCPVGALTSRPFRFSARTWELSRRRSVSPHDGVGANLIVQTRFDRVKRVLPLENEAINECWLSDKDRFSYEALNGDERLSAPMIRRGTQWCEVSWQEALEFVANGCKAALDQQGPSAIGALASPHSTLEELHLLQKLVRALGSENIDFRLRHSDFRADGKRNGAPCLGMPLADVERLDRVLVIGSFLRKDAPLLAQRLRQAVKKGTRLSVVHPAADDWGMPVHQRALVAPSAMVDTLLHILFALADIKQTPPQPVLQSLRPASQDATATDIARELAEGRNVAVWIGNLAVQDVRGTEIELLAQEIARLAGGRFGVISEAANTVGGWLTRAVPGAGGKNVHQMLESPLAVCLLLGAEPGYDFARSDASRRALAAMQMVVALTPFNSGELREVAHVMLPLTPFTEMAGTFVNMEGRAQFFHAAARPLGEARPGWKVLRVLGNLLEASGFAQNDVLDVAREVLGEHAGKAEVLLETGLDGRLQGVSVEGRRPRADTLERVCDVPLHFADPLVRRAPALQRTHDARAPQAAVHPETLARLGLEEGAHVRLTQGDAVIELDVRADDGLAQNCVRVAAAHASTIGLGAMSGPIAMERV